MKRTSLTAGGKGKSRGSLKGQRSASVESDTSSEMQLEEARELLWRALPTVQALADQHRQAAPDVADEGDSQPVGLFDDVEVPWSEMRSLVTSLFLATHTNAIQDDVDSAVTGVVGSAAEPVQSTYTKSDVNVFLDTVPSLWMTLQDTERLGDRQHRQYCEELVKAVTDDEEPFGLVEAKRVLTVVRATTLSTPLDQFVVLPEPSACAPVFAALWHNIVDGRSTTAISLSQFRVFFVWFYALHFANTTTTRSEAVAEYVYRRFRGGDASGMLEPHFEAACRYMTRCYAQRRDTEQYLEVLVAATKDTLRAGGVDTSGSLFFSVGDKVTSGLAPRKTLLDPQTLYVPDELCAWHHDAELYQTPLSANRICLYGRRGTGKTTVGNALASRLHCAHLDVLALAERALAEGDPDDPLAQQLQDALQDDQPISLSLQAALLRRELELKGLYHGYVWSETFPVTSDDTIDVVSELLQNVGVSSSVQPSVFVHLTMNDEVYQERLTHVLSERAAARASVLNDPASVRADQQKRLEASQRACEQALERLVVLEGRDAGGSEAHDAELEAARTEAEQAQLTLAQLEAEIQHAAAQEEEQAAIDGEEGAEANGEVLDEEEQARRAALHQAALRTTKLTALILAGREALLKPLAPQDDNRAREEERELTVVPSLKKAVENAAFLAKHLVVDALSDSVDIAEYIVDALQLEQCAIATVPPLEELDEGSNGGAPAFAPTVAGDEQLGQALEEAATASGAVQSAVWKHYCPVTFTEDKVLVEGAACYLCVYRTEVYYCASRRKRELFMGNPFRYLKESPATRQRTLVLATDQLLSRLAETNLHLDAVAAHLATTLQLTHLDMTKYADAVRQRRDLRQARKEALAQRRQAFTEERQARDERQEKRMKLEAKKKKKDTRKSDTRQATVRFTSDVPVGNAGGVPRRKVHIQDAVQERIEDVIAKTISDEKEKSRESVPVLLALTDADSVDRAAFDLLYAERMVPERVVVLDHMPSTATEGDGDEEEEQEDGAAADETEATNAATGSASAGIMDGLLHQLEHGAPTGWKKDDSGLPAQSFTVERVNVAGKDQAELLLELQQILSPGAVACKEGNVNEELGNPEDREEDPDEAEEAAAGEEADDNIPALPRKPPQHALALPGPRFLNQFGHCLNYCPVTLHEKRLVVHGKHEYCTDYRQQLYVFASEDCLSRFQANPLKYVDHGPPRDIPPRIWVVGSTNSGRHTLARDLQASFQIPHFSYDRKFFEACIEATMRPGGAEVSGIHIPYVSAGNPYVERAQKLLKGVRDAAEAEEKGLKLRAEAQRKLEEMERRAEAAAEASDPDDEEAPELDEEEEEKLRQEAEFEPEDDEEKQTRLTETYLRIASCVTRFEPFESKGYIMVCPPFSELDQDVLFAAGGIPEVVVYLRQSAESFRDRAEVRNAALRKAREALVAARRDDPSAREKAAAREQRRRERLLRKWRRRHIGAEDPPSEPDEDENAGEAVANADDEAAAGDGLDEMDVEGTLSLEMGAIEEFITAVKERQVDVVTIEADHPLETVRRLARERLHNRLEDRLSFFSACEVLTYEAAMKQLEEGRSSLSVFGMHDPVALYEVRLGKRRTCTLKPDGISLVSEGIPEDGSDDAPGHTGILGPAAAALLGAPHRDLDDADDADDTDKYNTQTNAGADEEEDKDEEEPDDELSEYGSEDLGEWRERDRRRERILAKRAAPRACRLGCRVFFFRSDHSLLDFMRNPLFFVEQPPPPPTMRSRPVLAVFDDVALACSRGPNGRDDGRKHRTAAEHVAFNLGYEFISIPKLLSWASLHPRLGSLRFRALQSAMQHSVDADLVGTLLTLRLGDARVKRSGAVLQNLPRTVSQCARLAAQPAAASSPIVKVATLLAPTSSGAVASHMTDAAADIRTVASRVVPALQSTAGSAVALPVPCPAKAQDLTNVVGMVHAMDDLEQASRDCLLRGQAGFPADLKRAFYPASFLEQCTSEYHTYCPYCWVEESILMECFSSNFRASYLGRVYFFHSAQHLNAFLARPGAVADPDSLQPLPASLPMRVNAEEVGSVVEDNLEYQGCCPVVLYDTREQCGLRGVVEPVAQTGSRDCLVRYDGKLYALRDEANLARFMQQPWLFVKGAALPPSRKRPLTPKRRQEGISDEDFVRRQLYDAVAHALIAVGTERPAYPGLSAEESALKYMALHMKAHNAAENNNVQDEQYKSHFEVFRKRATLYTSTGIDSQLTEEACAEYERLRYGFHAVAELATLKKAA